MEKSLKLPNFAKMQFYFMKKNLIYLSSQVFLPGFIKFSGPLWGGGGTKGFEVRVCKKCEV